MVITSTFIVGADAHIGPKSDSRGRLSLQQTCKICAPEFQIIAKRYRNFPEGEISLIEDEYHTPQAYFTASAGSYITDKKEPLPKQQLFFILVVGAAVLSGPRTAGDGCPYNRSESLYAGSQCEPLRLFGAPTATQ